MALSPLPFLILIGIIQICFLIWGDGGFAVGRAGEDGSFYLEISRNMANGLGVTFDGTSPTNGVHWGWVFLMAAVFKIIPPTDPITMFRIAGVVYYSLLWASGFVIYRLTPIGALFMVALLGSMGHWFMETHLVLLTLALAIIWPNSITGFLLVAARSDMILFALFTGKWRLLGGAVIGFVWVCILNMLADGSPLSISAQIKSYGWNDFPAIFRISMELAKYYVYGTIRIDKATLLYYIVPILPIMCLIALFSIDRWFVASCLLLLIHITHNTEVHGWYLAPLFLTALLCDVRVFNRIQLALRDRGRLRLAI